MKCKKCGRKLRPDAKICIFCERPVNVKKGKSVKKKNLVTVNS